MISSSSSLISVLASMFVEMEPGQITLTLILYFASSSAVILAKATCPAFVVLYADIPKPENRSFPLIELVIIMLPPPRSFI
ncbi:hypothetical protein D3C81_1876480 [compost metagenome]